MLICPDWKIPCYPGFPTGNASPGQKGVSFCPGSGNRDKREPFVPVGNTNRDKRVRQPRGAGSQPGQKVAFCPGCQTRDKRTPLLSRPGGLGWEIGTTGFSNRDKSSFL